MAKTVPVQKSTPSKSGGGPTTQDRLKYGRNQAKINNQKGK